MAFELGTAHALDALHCRVIIAISSSSARQDGERGREALSLERRENAIAPFRNQMVPGVRFVGLGCRRRDRSIGTNFDSHNGVVVVQGTVAVNDKEQRIAHPRQIQRGHDRGIVVVLFHIARSKGRAGRQDRHGPVSFVHVKLTRDRSCRRRDCCCCCCDIIVRRRRRRDDAIGTRNQKGAHPLFQRHLAQTDNAHDPGWRSRRGITELCRHAPLLPQPRLPLGVALLLLVVPPVGLALGGQRCRRLATACFDCAGHFARPRPHGQTPLARFRALVFLVGLAQTSGAVVVRRRHGCI